MCTAVTYQGESFYFGRNLDYEHGFGQQIVAVPRNFALDFGGSGQLDRHYAMLGTACVSGGYPLFFDGFNEKGLAMAGLNFVGNARYHKAQKGQVPVPQYALIPWILGQCASMAEARQLLAHTAVTGEGFGQWEPAQLHWIIADRQGAITVEPVEEGLRIYENPLGVLTNNPPFPQQLLRLTEYMALSPEPPKNRFAQGIPEPYSRGMGAMGLPGDLSSGSRFVRAAFVKANSCTDGTEAAGVSQMFHILGAVEQQRGCCRLPDGQCEATIYSACFDLNRGIYYYTTYDDPNIRAVGLNRQELDTAELSSYPMIGQMEFHWQN